MEKLRDQGMPLPFWMRVYEVRSVFFEETTPALEITRRNGNITARIVGDVNLSPPSADVKTFPKASELTALPKQERKAARETLDQAVSLASVVRANMPMPEPLQVTTLTNDGARYRALAIPGGNTQALEPARLDEVDLVVLVAGGDEIRLARSFNSFFNPKGLWGPGWSLDLPRLEEVKVPQARDAQGSGTYRIALAVVTPLNSLYARFIHIAAMPEPNGSKLLAQDESGELLALADAERDFLTRPTRNVIGKDGAAWHFSEAGDLVTKERNGSRTVYERDADWRITRITGLRGKTSVASNQLSYDQASGRLKAAQGQREMGQTVRDQHRTGVRYEYNDAGALVAVRSGAGRVGYRFEGARIAAGTYRAAESNDNPASQELTVRRFHYDRRGQLLAETDSAGSRTEYRVVTNAAGRNIIR